MLPDDEQLADMLDTGQEMLAAAVGITSMISACARRAGECRPSNHAWRLLGIGVQRDGS